MRSSVSGPATSRAATADRKQEPNDIDSPSGNKPSNQTCPDHNTQLSHVLLHVVRTADNYVIEKL